MNELTPEDYVEILNGGRRGAHFSQNYYIVSRKEEKNPMQKQILLKEGMGLPSNINDEYEEVKNPKKKKRKRNETVDANLLRHLNKL